MYQVAGFGNALLDITVTIKTNELLEKYNFNEDDQREIPGDIMQALYVDISNLPKQMSPGGCAQNTLRILQWLLNKSNSTVFFGAVGDDGQSKILKELVDASGVYTRYIIKEQQMTGKCIALVYGPNRSLVANLAAAESISLSDIDNDETNKLLQCVKIIYLEGFFLTNRLNVAEYIKNFAIKNQKVFAFNLSGEYLCDMLPNDVLHFAKSANFVFGNQNEFLSIGKVLNKNNLRDIGLELIKSNNFSFYNSSSWNKHSLFRFGKVVIITAGRESVLCFYNNGEIFEMQVPQISPEKIRDTTGAGDSFVSGFLAGLLKNLSIEECLNLACWTASCIIQESGCTIPQYSSDSINL